MRRLLLLAAIVALGALGIGGASAGTGDSSDVLVADLSGDHQVPALASDGSGFASFTVSEIRRARGLRRTRTGASSPGVFIWKVSGLRRKNIAGYPARINVRAQPITMALVRITDKWNPVIGK